MPFAESPDLGGKSGLTKGNSNLIHWTSEDGLGLGGMIWPALGLDAETPGPGRPAEVQAPPLLCLPGLSRNIRDFDDIAGYLQERGQTVIALDYRGRGLSAWDDTWENYSIEKEATDIDRGLEALGLDRFSILGTSRGGLHAMEMAARHGPSRISSIILNDIGPHVEAVALVRISMSLGQQMEFENAVDCGKNLKTVMGDQFPTLSDAEWHKLAGQFGEVHRDGRFRLSYDPNLAKTLSDWKTAEDAPPWPDLWPLFEHMRPIPLLVLRGENSDLLSVGTCEKMLARHPNCEIMTIPGQGHAPLLWDKATQEKIASFLAKST